jgi:cytochrome c-type biogenesis protein CcsB
VLHLSMASLSNHLFASAVVVYVVAMVAYAARFALGRPAMAPAAVPAPAAAVPALVGGPAASGPPPAAAASAAAAAAAPVDDGPSPADRSARRREKAGRMAVALTVLGVALHVAEVITRGFADGRVPWGNMYEFSSIAGLIAVVAFLVVQARHPRVRDVGVFVMLLVSCYLGLAGTVLYAQAGPLVPALDSYWLKIHVVAAMTATGTFMVTGVVSCLHLVRRRYDRRIAAGRLPGGWGLGRRLPSASVLDRTEYRVIAFAFPVWTFAVIAGAIWAESAWGSYWSWDPKETWSFVTWLVYAAYLHVRSTRSWRRAAPVVALLGFGCLLFNYYVINIFISGLHSYAGL